MRLPDELPYRIKITVEDEMIAAEEQAEVSQKVDSFECADRTPTRDYLFTLHAECSYEEIARSCKSVFLS